MSIHQPNQPDWSGLGKLSVQQHKILAAAQPELPKSFRSWGKLTIAVMMTMVYDRPSVIAEW